MAKYRLSQLSAYYLASKPLPSVGVMAFSEVLSDISNHGKYSLSLYDMGRYMRLDAAAQRALNVMKTKFDANDNFSLYGLMSRARTSMGKRLLKASTYLIMCTYTCEYADNLRRRHKHGTCLVHHKLH